MKPFDESTLKELQHAFVLTLELLQDPGDDAIMIHSKLPYLLCGPQLNGFTHALAVDLPTGPNFNSMLLTSGVLPLLTNVVFTGENGACEHRHIRRSATASLEPTMAGLSIAEMLEPFWDSTTLRCVLWKQADMSCTRRLHGRVKAVIVDVAWEHHTVVAISTEVALPL